MLKSFAFEVGRSGIEKLFCNKGYKVKEIAQVYDISAAYLYSCLKQLYGADWKKYLSEKRKGVFDYEKHNICRTANGGKSREIFKDYTFESL